MAVAMAEGVVVHPISEVGTGKAAAVTLAGGASRLTANVKGVFVSDVDDRWTRCYAMTSDADVFSEVVDAEGVVRGTESLLEFAYCPSVCTVGIISTLHFKNAPGRAVYGKGDRVGLTLELRQVEWPTKSPGELRFVWRAVDAHVLPDATA